MERVFVTGSRGFAGEHFARCLTQHGAQVIGYAGDVRDREELRRALQNSRPDAIAHLAAASSVASSWSSRAEVWDVNATGTANVALAAADLAAGVRVLVVSSAEVYGRVPDEAQPIPESRNAAPISPYGVAKAAAEVAALGSCDDVIVARSFNHIGPGQDARFAIPSFARQIARIELGAEPILKVGDLEARRDLSDVRCVVEAYRLLLQAPAAAGIYNVCSGVAVAMREILERLLGMTRKRIKVQVDPERLRPSDVTLLCGDPTRIRDATGWRVRRDLDETLSDTLDYFRKLEGTA